MSDSAAETPPAAGEGVALLEHGGCFPGTVLYVSTTGQCLWFETDPRPEQTSPMAAADRVHCATRADDGRWRDYYTKWPVARGIHPCRPVTNLPAPEGETTLEHLSAQVERLEPFLLRTQWPPMSYMLIPSVLKRADELIATLSLWKGEFLERSRATQLRQRLEGLRAGFRNQR